jgi:HK97 family phage prohead protease
MERRNLLGPCEWKAVAGSSKGELDGYGVFFNNIDLGDDVALPGSAKKTLADRQASGRPWPLIADHELKTDGVVGSARDAREDNLGVRLRAEFASTQKAQDLRTLVLEGHVDGMSITYEPLRHHFGQKSGQQVRFLDEIRIHEFTITPFPMNPQARIISAKAGDPEKPYGDVTYADPGYQADKKKRYPLDTEEHCRAAWSYISQSGNAGKYSSDQLSLIKGRIRAALSKLGVTVSESSSLDFSQFSDGMRAALGIGFAPASKAAADLLVAAYHPLDDAAPDDDPEPAADAAAPDEGTAEIPADDPAAYALGIITPPGPRDGAPGGEPPKALAGPLAQLEMDRAAADMDRLEADLLSAQGGTA